MRGVLISLPPADIQALKNGRRYVVLSRPVRKQDDRPLDILLYSSQSAGGSGLIEGTGYAGRCSQFSPRSHDAAEDCWHYGVELDKRAPGERFYQEIICFRALPTPVPIEAYAVSGSANPPQKDWKYIQIGDSHGGIYPESRFEILEQ